jgi:hypothetical protein
MENNLKKNKKWKMTSIIFRKTRMTSSKSWKMTSKKKWTMTSKINKMEDKLFKNGRQSPKKMEDDQKKNGR